MQHSSQSSLFTELTSKEATTVQGGSYYQNPCCYRRVYYYRPSCYSSSSYNTPSYSSTPSYNVRQVTNVDVYIDD